MKAPLFLSLHNGSLPPHGARTASGAVELYSPDEARDDHGRWTSGGGGDSGTTTSTNTMFDRLQTAGGFTVHPVTGNEPKTGYAIAIEGHSGVFDAEKFFGNRAQAIADTKAWLRENQALFADPAMHVGGWHDTEAGKVVLDPAEVIANLEDAKAAGIVRNQRAIFDLAKGDTISTGGTGGYAELGYNATYDRSPKEADRPRRSTEAGVGNGRPGAGGLRHEDRGCLVLNQGLTLELYSDDEPRDDHGRWTSGGGDSVDIGPGGDFHQGKTIEQFLAANPRLPGEDVFVWQGRIVQQLPPEKQNEVLFRVRERYPPCDYIANGADRWCDEHGLPRPPSNIADLKVNLAEAEAVGHYFERAPDASGDPRVQAAYADFKAQSAEQWDFMTRPESQGGLGIKVDFSPSTDPYTSAAAQAADLRDNHHITIQSGLGGAHDLTMTTPEYDRFRAVHDVFGHAGVGGGFDRHGEYQAWLMHASMYTGGGRDAMSTEYHGVNSALWSGDPANKGGTGKSILLPPEYSNPPWDRHA